MTKQCTKAGHETLLTVPRKLYELAVNFEYYYLIRNVTPFLFASREIILENWKVIEGWNRNLELIL